MTFKVIKDSSGRETDRTIAFLDENVYHVLLQQNRTYFKIDPFIVPNSFHPNLIEYTYNFCIPFPDVLNEYTMSYDKDSTSKRDTYFISLIDTKLSPFVSQGVIANGSYEIKIPVISREGNKTKAMAFITFHPSVNKDNLTVIRYILDGSIWTHNNAVKMVCLWAKLSKKIANRVKSSS